jgi:CheY-like chemotaxis protein
MGSVLTPAADLPPDPLPGPAGETSAGPDAADESGLQAAIRVLPAEILVVDDDPLSRTLQARMLALLGHHPLVATSAAAALEAALEAPIDGMLLDLSMPDMDGFTLLAKIREHEALHGRRPLPIIAVTGYAAALDRLRCLMAGFNDHVSKPVDAASLSAVLSRNIVKTTAFEAASACSDAQRVQAAARRLARAKPADTAFGPTVLEAFAMRSGQLVEDLQRAQGRDDGIAVRRVAEALGSSAEFMGASGLARLCAQVCAAADDAESRARLIQQLVDEHQAVLTVLLQAVPRDPLRAGP